MSACPYRNILDPKLYSEGNHHESLAEIRESGGALVEIDDPLTGIPYRAVMKRDLADKICKEPIVFSSERMTAVPKEMPEEEMVMQRLMIVNMDPPNHIKYRRIARKAFTP